MAAKRRLGRGLESLIPPPGPAGEAPATEGVQEIEISRIELSPVQPREEIDEEALEALAESIRTSGVLQPVLVRPRGELYELVAGERRLRAAHLAGLERVPAIVREVPDERLLELALVENVHREDLSPIEKARAIRQMMEQLGLTQEEAAARLALKRPTVANLLRLLSLPEDIQRMVSRGTLSAGHARAVLAVEDPGRQRALARRIAERGLSVREAERLAARGPSARPRREPSPQVRRLEGILREALGTRVDVRASGRRGRIVIHFDGPEQFERLFERLTGLSEDPIGD